MAESIEKIRTSITIDKDLHKYAKQNGIKMSSLLNKELRRRKDGLECPYCDLRFRDPEKMKEHVQKCFD